MQQQKLTETVSSNPPKRSAILDMLLKVDPQHKLVKKYQEQYEKYLQNLQHQVEKLKEKSTNKVVEIELKPIDIKSFYSVFVEAYEYFNHKPFDETVNNGEGKKLAGTICLYLAGKKAFLKSPLINKEVSEPSLNKGLLMVGGKGVGKTSIMRTFYEMLFYARNNPLTVKDIEGNIQQLKRYQMGFGFFSADEVVDAYEFCLNELEKKAFNKKFAFGFKYFDDIMAEEMAQNYGKRDIFRKMFEKRYYNNAKTMISMNYHDEENGIQKNLTKTLLAFRDRYGDRVFDRSYEMFNIIELKGSSLRK